jgi:Spy/CpxP family protein refolding chaperone
MMNVSSLSRGLALAVVLGAAAPVLGCGGTAASEPAASAGQASTRAPVAPTAHGPVRLIGEALGDVPLSAPQRSQLEQLAADAEARHADERAARADLMNALAAQVQGGAIDRAALQPKVAALTAAVEKAQPADRAALEQLHAVLGPDQRVAFVDALKARIHERMGEVRDKHPLKRWADDLQLTDDQRAQIRSAFRAHFEGAGGEHHDGGMGGAQPMRRGAKIFAAFEQERFVLDEIAPPLDVQRIVAQKADHFLTMAELTLPVLTPSQRATAAEKLRDRAQGAAPDEVTP